MTLLVNDLKTGSSMEMVFNLDISKQAIEVIFSAKGKTPEHPERVHNGVAVARYGYTKHLGVYLGIGLNLAKHIGEAVLKALRDRPIEISV